MVRDPNTGEITARPRTAADGTSEPGEPQPQPAQTDGGKIKLAEGV